MITCQAFLFDLDGTLVDSYVDAEACWRSWAASVGALERFDFNELYGRRRDEMISTLLPRLPPVESAEHAQAIRCAERESTSNVTALPGSASLLSKLPPGSWAIVTSNDRDVALARIRAAGLPVPSILLTSDEIERAKPDPQGLLLASSMLNVPAGRALAIDDSPVGIEAANRAQMQSIAVRFKHSDGSLQEADLIVDNLSCLNIKSVPDGFIVEVG